MAKHLATVANTVPQREHPERRSTAREEGRVASSGLDTPQLSVRPHLRAVVGSAIRCTRLRVTNPRFFPRRMLVQSHGFVRER